MPTPWEYLVRISEPLTPTSWRTIASTHGRSTAGSDTPANRHVPPTLAAPPTFQLSIFDGIEPVLNPRGSIGGVVLLDPKGVLDNLLFGVLDGGVLELRRGAVGAAYSSFSTVAAFTFMTAGMLAGHDSKETRLHNLARLALVIAFLGVNVLAGLATFAREQPLDGRSRIFSQLLQEVDLSLLGMRTSTRGALVIIQETDVALHRSAPPDTVAASLLKMPATVAKGLSSQSIIADCTIVQNWLRSMSRSLGFTCAM